MADVKTLTVHGTTYNIKDENARNSISTLQSTVSGHTTDISGLKSNVSTLQSTVSGHTTDISGLESDVSTLQSTVSGHTTQISSINSSLATKITGDWFFDNYTPQTDQQIPLTPNFLTAYSGNFNASGGVYLITVSGLLMQGGQGNTEVMISVNGGNNQIANTPTNANQYYSVGVGVVNIPAGNSTIKVLLRNTNSAGTLKAYSSLYITAVKIKNL